MVRVILATPMLIRSFAPRLLAALLTVNWGALALVLLVAPARGAVANALLALGAVVPAAAGVEALCLAVPLVVHVAGSGGADGAQPAVPSASVAYAALFAAWAT